MPREDSQFERAAEGGISRNFQTDEDSQFDNRIGDVKDFGRAGLYHDARNQLANTLPLNIRKVLIKLGKLADLAG